MWRDDAYLLDMLLSARKALQFTRWVAWKHFDDNKVPQHAIMRAIQIIGKAARHVSTEYQEAHPEIPWRGIAGMHYLTCPSP